MVLKIPLFEKLFNDYGLSEEDKGRIRRDLEAIKAKDEETFLHSVRVTLLSMKIAKQLGMDPKPLLFAAPRHDDGKILVPNKVLKKKKNWGPEDSAIMKAHPVDSFRMLEPTNAFSAYIDVDHHRHGENPYPKRLPKGETFVLSPKAKRLAFEYSKPLAIADCWDAAVNRKNSRFGGKRITLKLIREAMLHDLSHIQPMVNKLFEEKFFTQQMLANTVMGREKRRLSLRATNPILKMGAGKRTPNTLTSVKGRVIRRR
ncbi:MAG: HD domain-containing protein [archaeon]|jgi:hypothetical protein